MGGGAWNDADYTSRSSTRAATGAPTFAHSAAVASGRASWIHETLDPKKIKRVRESRDSVDHPNSVPLIVLLDVTGSMGDVPDIVQAALPKLMGLLTRKNYVEDPQICFGAIGDEFSDRYPFQVGQFESDIRIESDLTNMIIEGGGGGTMQESYELALYFAARKVESDAWTKRNKKGYLFITGDETTYTTISKEKIEQIFGDKLQEDISIEKILEEVKERFHVFYVKPGGSSYENEKSIPAQWKKLFGPENYLKLEDPAAICELIALQIGLIEGTTDVDSATDDMKSVGTSTAIVHVATSAIDPKYKSTGSLAKVPPGALSKPGDTKVERL